MMDGAVDGEDEERVSHWLELEGWVMCFWN